MKFKILATQSPMFFYPIIFATITPTLYKYSNVQLYVQHVTAYQHTTINLTATSGGKAPTCKSTLPYFTVKAFLLYTQHSYTRQPL